MKPDRRQELEERRRLLQIQHAAEAFTSSSLEPYLEILQYLKLQGIAFDIIQLMYVKREWETSLRDRLKQAPYPGYGFHPGHLEERGMEEKINQLYGCYPSSNPLRYVPTLPKYADYNNTSADKLREGLPKASAALGLADQKVFLYYLRYAPLIEVALSDLLNHDDNELFNFWHGDAVVFPSDLSWLMAFTLEEEWHAGSAGT